MAREKRQVSESGIYRINLSGNDGEIFKRKEDYDEFKALLERYFQDERKVFGYSLTETGADMVVMVGKQSIGPAMKPLLTSYARYFNRTYGRNGKVFHDRYKSEPVKYEELDDIIEKFDYADREEILQAKRIKRQQNKMDFWLL